MLAEILGQVVKLDVVIFEKREAFLRGRPRYGSGCRELGGCRGKLARLSNRISTGSIPVWPRRGAPNRQPRKSLRGGSEPLLVVDLGKPRVMASVFW